MIVCKNCAHSFEGNYCPMCRQAADTDRITWHEILHHAQHALFHADRGLFYTIKELFLRPGPTLKAYVEGKRIKHFNPFLFLILGGGLVSYLFFALHLAPPVRHISLEQVEHFNAMLAHKYFALVGVLFLILLSVSDYFFYRKSRLLLTELIIVNTFQAAQVMVLTLLAIPFLLLQENLATEAEPAFEGRTVFKVIVLLYLFFTRYQFYNARHTPWLSLRIGFQLVLLIVLYEYLISRALVYLLS